MRNIKKDDFIYVFDYNIGNGVDSDVYNNHDNIDKYIYLNIYDSNGKVVLQKEALSNYYEYRYLY